MKNNYGYCEKCGLPIIKKETRKGSYSKRPVYYNTVTGKEKTNTHYACPNQTFFGSHREYWINND